MMKKVRWKEMATGVVLGTVFMSPWSSLFEVRPYTNVQLVSVAKADTSVTITANFRKTDCSFQCIKVKIPGAGYDTIEIRTRHLCDGAKVDKVFITVDSKDLI